MTDAPTDFNALIDLEEDGPDIWIGLSAEYRWGRIFGGQVVAQALWAALKTVDLAFAPHSLHAYFIRAGDIQEPVRFEVCLLYTSPSPRDATLSRMPSSA